ncbi:cell division protein FtsQ/DivIB [Clostridium sediminicola]|uniref:cell division protein FtsQ/DivIB n=1 Tax=Clostridium sediminicola TaxID=3114879 RepID=UPI003D1777B9
MQNKKKKRKNKFSKRVLFFIFLTTITIFLLIKLPIFEVKNIIVRNNLSIKSEKIIESSNIKLGTNIFLQKPKDIKKSILVNKEIADLNIKKKIPNSIIIDIEERNYIFYVYNNGCYYLLDANGYVFDKKDDLEDRKLIEIIGLGYEKLKEGESLEVADNRKIDIVSSLTGLLRKLEADIEKPNSIDITDLADIELYYGDMRIMIGDASELKSKLNIGINILYERNLLNKKGYVDVSYKGNPVFYVEN